MQKLTKDEKGEYSNPTEKLNISVQKLSINEKVSHIQTYIHD
jgi:hypothetical protein